MKALYFDCSSGISGNMTLGALLELMDDKEYLVEQLQNLGIDGYHLDVSKKVKNGITSTHVDVIVEEHHHHHEEHHHHRNLYDINKIIDDSSIEQRSKDLAKRIFLRVAKAESKVHNEPLEKVHFHEVGAIDSIVDIIGTAILINYINPDVIYSSIVNDGYGFIECAHGTIPVPVPATSEIFSNSEVVYKQIDIDTELVTPTGAAIIAELATKFSPMPAMKVERIGWGAGTKELRIPNVLKVSLGSIVENQEDVLVMETNMDDCSGEILAYTVERLLENNALDAFFTPIYMKKNRPAYMLSVICYLKDKKELEDIIFSETTTIGIRYRSEKRTVLDRKKAMVETPYGPLEAKQVFHNGHMYTYPEYESVKKVAQKNNVSLKEIYQVVK